MALCSICKKRERQGNSYCKQCFKEYHKKWYLKNQQGQRKKLRENAKKYRATHAQEIKDYRKKWKKQNPNYNKKYSKEWRKKNPNKVKEHNKNYSEVNKERLKLRNYAYKMLREKMLKDIGKCQICNSKYDLQLHHISYKSNKDNLILLCRSCHRKKHNGN